MAYAYTTFYLTTVAMLLLDILYLMLMIYGLYTLLRRTNRTKSFALNLQTHIFYWLIIISCCLSITFATLWLNSGLRVMRSNDHLDTIPIQKLKDLMEDFIYVPDSLYPIICFSLFWQNVIVKYEVYSIKNNLWNPSSSLSQKIFILIIITYFIVQTIFIVNFNVNNNIPYIYPIYVNVSQGLIILTSYIIMRVQLHFKFSGNIYKSQQNAQKSVEFERLALTFAISKIVFIAFLLYLIIKFEKFKQFVNGELDLSNFVQLFFVFFASMGIIIGSILPFYFAIKPECFKLFLIDQSRESLLRTSQEIDKPNQDKQNKKFSQIIGETSLKVFKCQRLAQGDFQILDQKNIKTNGFGKFYSGLIDQNNDKIFRVIDLPAISQFIQEEINQELNIFDKLSFKYIGKLYGIYVENNRVVMITKFYDNGSLYNYHNITNRIGQLDTNIPSKTKDFDLALEIACTLNFLHSQVPPIVHGHLKPQNIMLSKNFHVRIVDIGFRTIKKLAGHILGYNVKSAFSSPEQLAEKNLTATPQSDIYALGMILYEIFNHKYPFEGLSLQTITKLVLTDHQRPKILDDTSNEMSALIRWCWQQDAQKRPTAFQVMESLEQIRNQYEQENTF